MYQPKPLITPALSSHRPPPNREKRESFDSKEAKMQSLQAPSLPAGGRAMGVRGREE